MENMDVLVRGAGVGIGMSLQGLEWAWVAVVATLVIAVVSAKRVSIVSVGWTWGAKPGQVRVRVHSFSSMSDGTIVTASGMFSAEILNCSADSCSEAAVSSSSSSTSSLEPSTSKVAAEMVFIFEKKTPPPLTYPRNDVPFPAKIVRKRTKSLPEFLQKKLDLPLLSFPLRIEAPKPPALTRAGVEWDVHSPLDAADSQLLPLWGQSLAAPMVAYTAPSFPSWGLELPTTTTSSTSCEWDPLLKLRIRDAVLHNGAASRTLCTLPLAPVTTAGASIVTLQNGVVRLWDTATKSVMKSVLLPKGSCVGKLTAFDADWESKTAAFGDSGGAVSFANLESAASEKSYQTRNHFVQAIHLEKSSLAKTLFTGGPATANPGCTVSLWDTRSSHRQLSVPLTSAQNVHGIRSLGHELYLRDSATSFAAHDVRMLGASSVSRVACDVKSGSAPQDRWWEMATSPDFEQDVDGEFWDCLTAEEFKGSGGSYVGSFVKAMSRNFSIKAK